MQTAITIKDITAESDINHVRKVVFTCAWKKVKQYGKSLSEALITMWRRAKRQWATVREEANRFSEYRTSASTVELNRYSKREVGKPASVRQYDFLASLIGEDNIEASKHAFTKYYNVKEVSKAIDCAKRGGQVIFN